MLLTFTKSIEQFSQRCQTFALAKFTFLFRVETKSQLKCAIQSNFLRTRKNSPNLQLLCIMLFFMFSSFWFDVIKWALYSNIEHESAVTNLIIRSSLVALYGEEKGAKEREIER